MDKKKLLFLIFGAQIAGLGTSLRALDTNTTGSDDLAGNVAAAGGQILTAIGTDNVAGLKKALELNIQISQEYIAANFPG